MSSSATSLLEYSIRCTCNDTVAPTLILRFGSCSRLVSRSLSAGIPDFVLQQTPSTLMGEAQFPFPLWDNEKEEAPLFSQYWVIQFLSSFNLCSSACEIFFQNIFFFAQNMAVNDINTNFCIEADIIQVQTLWIEPFINEADDVLILDFEEDPAMRRAPKSAIERLRKQKFDVKEIMGDCCVCCDDLDGGKEEITKMPCGHVYHRSCILTWLQRSNSCPLCRAPLQEQ